MKRKGQSGDTGNNRHTRRNTKKPTNNTIRHDISYKQQGVKMSGAAWKSLIILQKTFLN